MSMLHKMLMASGRYTPKDCFKAIAYIGTGAERSITGVGFKPDFVWIKCRSSANSHQLFDNIRGVNKTLYSDANSAEVSDTDALMSFDEDGFTIGADTGVNNVGSTYVAWCWKANNNTGTSNTEGTITSTVNAGKSFSIVKYTGNGTSGATVGHGLPTAPTAIIIKGTDNSWNWSVYHQDITEETTLLLNSTAGEQSYSPGRYFPSAPDNSVITLGYNGVQNASGDEYIAYCFTDIPGSQKMGSYTGTGAVDNEINCGFQPAYVLIKRADSTGNWGVFDNKRDTHNPNTAELFTNSTAVEAVLSGGIDFTSTGFKLQTTDTDYNASGGSYVYIAFAELPEKDSPENHYLPLFNMIKYTGNNIVGRNIDGAGFKPDLVWAKGINGAIQNWIFDSMRGSGKYILTNSVQAESSQTNVVQSLDADGVTVGNDSEINSSSYNYIHWCWNAGGEIEPNNDGTIPCTIMANPEGGFSILKYTGTGVAGTIGHGLGKTPKIVIIKPLSNADSWRVGSSELTSWAYNLLLESTSNEYSNTAIFNSTSPDSSIIHLGGSGGSNTNGYEYVAYVWTDISGLSDFGSYTGNGSTTGTIIDCGFQPDWVMIKRTDSTGNWNIFDTKRGIKVGNDSCLLANSYAAETTSDPRIKLTSSGFQLEDTSSEVNASGGTYIYIAFKITDNPNTLHQIETGKLLIDGETTIEDENGTHTITANGDTQISTTEKATGSSSILFDGTGDYLTIPDSSDWDLSGNNTEDYTVDLWVKHSTHASQEVYFGQMQDANNYWKLDHTHGSGLAFGVIQGGSGVITSGYMKEITDAYWHHIAIVKEESTYRFYLDGITIFSMANAAEVNFTGSFYIGSMFGYSLNGYIDHFRVTKGKALWTTTNFNLTDKGLYYPSGTLNI